MSNLEQLKINIYKYIENPMDKYALLLNGNWGSGKTYAIKKIIEEYNKEKKKEKIIYVSFNGISNIDEVFYKCLIRKKILEVDDEKNKTKSKSKEISKKVSTLKGIKIAKGVIEHFSGIDIDNIFSPFEYILTKSDEIDLVVLDDIERCNCPIDEIFGYVDRLLNNKIKVLLISDIEKIEEKENYNEIKEKIIGNIIEWKPDIFCFKSIVNNIEYDKFSLENSEIFKKIFFELENEMFNIIENKKKIKKINLRVLNKTIAHSIYIIDLLNCGKENNIKLLYKEIVKNVYVYFHKQTYIKEKIEEKKENEQSNFFLFYENDSSQIQRIELNFVKDYFSNGNYIEKEKYIKTINELLANDEDIYFVFDDKQNEQLLSNKAKKIIDNINNYPIYYYGSIINTLYNIDICLKTNFLFKIKNSLIKNIKNDNNIIYCFNRENCSFMHWLSDNIQKEIIEDINMELIKHNRRIAYKMLIEYMYNPFKIEKYMDIFIDKLYINDGFIGIDNFILLKFIAEKMNNKKLLNHLFKQQSYCLYFDYIFKLIHCISPDAKPYIKKLNIKLEKIKEDTTDKYFKFYLNREINTIADKFD